MRNLHGLLAFVETAAAGTLTAAAERLEITPAAVSKSLAKFEQQLGVRLFNRSTRRLALTQEGERFLSDARQALRMLDEAVAHVGQAASAPAGLVRISVGIAFGRRFVLPALPALAATHPQLKIEVDLENHPVDLIAKHYDIGIRGGVIEDSSLIARRICALPLVLLASPDYLRAAGIPQSPDQLHAHQCAATRLGDAPPLPWCFRASKGKRTEVTPAHRLLVNDPEALVDLAVAGAGIVQTGLQHALPHLRAGRLKLLMPGLHDPGQREVVLHYPHRQYLAPRVRVVVDGLLAHFSASPELQLDVASLVAAHPEIIARA